MIPYSVLNLSFLAFGIAFVTGAIFASPILKGLIALKSRQNVYSLAPESHQKKQGTPTMGGIIILLGLLVGIAATTKNWQVCLWVLGFAFIGFADDFIIPKLMKGKRGLGWKQKIVAQLVLAILAAPTFGVPFSALPVAAIAFSVLFFSNAYNFADGLDALAGSLGLILCFGFGALSASTDQASLILPVMAALAGGFLPFLFLNAPPAKVFMGDVGALPIGALFGAVAALMLIGFPPTSPTLANPLAWHPNLILPVLVLGFVMIAELVPVPMQVAYYKLTKKRLFPMTPIHHSFEVKGWPESRVVWSFVFAQLVLAVVAIGLVGLSSPTLPPSGRYHYYYYENSVSLNQRVLTEAHR